MAKSKILYVVDGKDFCVPCGRRLIKVLTRARVHYVGELVDLTKGRHAVCTGCDAELDGSAAA